MAQRLPLSENYRLGHALAQNGLAVRGPQKWSERMRKLIFALTAVSAIGFAVPASAQTFFAHIGYGPGWGYYVPLGYGYRSAWGPGYAYAYYAPPATVYGAPPVVRRYVVRERPVLRRIARARPVVRYGAQTYRAYAYSQSRRRMIRPLPLH